MTTLCLYLAVTPASTVLLGEVTRSHANLGAASFVATSRFSDPAQTIVTKYGIDYRWPSEFKIRTLDPTTGRTLKERVIERSRVVDYDPALMQYTSTERPSGDSLGKTLASIDKDLDDLLLAFADPEGIDVWATDMLKLRPWRIAQSGGKTTMGYSKGGHKIVLDVDTARRLLRKVDITTGSQRLVWDIAYSRSVGRTVFRPPADATEVPVFDREMALPTYANAEARDVSQRMFGAYEGRGSMAFEVTRDTGTTKVQMAGKTIRQEDANATWTYDGRRLVLFSKRTNRWYSGELGFIDVIDLVAQHGTRVDPTASLMYRRFNPYRKRLGDGAKVKLVGTMPYNGEEVSILECESPNALLTLFVRKDGLVAGSSVTGKSSTGTTVDLRYKYLKLDEKAASGLRLRVPSGQKPVALKPTSD